MSVEPLKVGKKFIKVEDSLPKPKVESKNISSKSDKKSYTYIPQPNGNIDVDVFMDNY